MILQIKVKVKIHTLSDFAEKLTSGHLDRSAIISETFCEKDDPCVGISYWKISSMEEFQDKFSQWKQFYETFEVKEVITAKEAIIALFNQK